MNKVQELIRKLPALCGAKESWGRSGELQYLDEISNPEIYPRVEGETFADRGESYVTFADFSEDPEKAAYGLGLLALIDANHCGLEKYAEELKTQLQALSGNYPDIDAILTFEEASIMSFWNP